MRKRKPSTRSAHGLGRGPSVRGAERSARIRPSITKETAKLSASARNGSQRVTPYSRPPSGPPTSEATCWRAWFWLSAVGRSSVGTTARTADASAGLKAPEPMPVRVATTSRCGTVRWCSMPATTREA